MKTLQELSGHLNGKVWERGNIQRIYLKKGYNTRKMSTKTFVWQNEEGRFIVSCHIECDSQPYQWIESQEEKIKDYLYEDIQNFIDGIEDDDDFEC